MNIDINSQNPQLLTFNYLINQINLNTINQNLLEDILFDSNSSIQFFIQQLLLKWHHPKSQNHLNLSRNEKNKLELKSQIQKMKSSFKICRLPKSQFLLYCHTTQLKLKNTNFHSLQLLQNVYWESLKTLQLPKDVTMIKSIKKCRFPSLKNLDISLSNFNDHPDLYRSQFDQIEQIKYPIHRGNRLGIYLNYIKISSDNKKQFYLNYLRKIPNKLKCIQQQYIEFQMDYLYIDNQ